MRRSRVPARRPAPAAPRKSRRCGLVSPGEPVVVAAVLALVALGVAAWRHAGERPRARAGGPQLFTFPTRPAESAGPVAHGAGRGRLRRGPTPAGGGRRRRVGRAPGGRGGGQPVEHALPRRSTPRRCGRQENGSRPFVSGPKRRASTRISRCRTPGPWTSPGAPPMRRASTRPIVAGNPRKSRPGRRLGRLLYRTGEYAKAAPYLQAAVQLRPDRPRGAAGARLRARAGRTTGGGRRRLPRGPPAGARRRTATRACSRRASSSRARRTRLSPCCRRGSRRARTRPCCERQMGSVLERSGRPAAAAAAYRTYAGWRPTLPTRTRSPRAPPSSRRRGGSHEAFARTVAGLACWPWRLRRGGRSGPGRRRSPRAAEEGEAGDERQGDAGEGADRRRPRRGPSARARRSARRPRRRPLRRPSEGRLGGRGAPLRPWWTPTPSCAPTSRRSAGPGAAGVGRGPHPGAEREAQPDEHSLHLRRQRQQQRERGGAGAGRAAAGRGPSSRDARKALDAANQSLAGRPHGGRASAAVDGRTDRPGPPWPTS